VLVFIDGSGVIAHRRKARQADTFPPGVGNVVTIEATSIGRVEVVAAKSPTHIHISFSLNAYIAGSVVCLREWQRWEGLPGRLGRYNG